MASTDDDTFGCIVIVGLLVVGAGWYFLENYDVTPRVEAEVDTLQSSVQIPARPSRPYQITSTVDGTIHRLDPSTVLGPREARRAWVEQDHTNDKTVAARKTAELLLVDCTTSGSKVLSIIQYDASDEVLYSRSWDPSEAQASYYPPGTVGAAAPREICRDVFDEAPPN